MEVDKAAIIRDLVAMMPPIKLPGDITVVEAATQINKSISVTRNWLMKVVKDSDDWESELVYDPETARMTRVFRRVDNE